MESDNIKKTCNHCLRIRPKKDNFCVINRYNVIDITKHTCEDFLLDKWSIEKPVGDIK